MCDLIEKLFLNVKPEDLNIQIDEKEVLDHYDKEKDELIVLIGKLKAENYSLQQRLIGLDMFLKQVCGETIKELEEEENKKKDSESSYSLIELEDIIKCD